MSDTITAEGCRVCGSCVHRPEAKFCSQRCYKESRRFSPAEVVARFWQRVHCTDCCWEWVGAIGHTGYGVLGVNQRLQSTHRYSWELANGPIPDGLFVCHRCDNRRCVRPDHLFLGTHKDNVRDAVAKGRHLHGARASEIRRRAWQARKTKALLS